MINRVRKCLSRIFVCLVSSCRVKIAKQIISINQIYLKITLTCKVIGEILEIIQYEMFCLEARGVLKVVANTNRSAFTSQLMIFLNKNLQLNINITLTKRKVMDQC